jgi:hypothetical protein
MGAYSKASRIRQWPASDDPKCTPQPASVFLSFFAFAAGMCRIQRCLPLGSQSRVVADCVANPHASFDQFQKQPECLLFNLFVRVRLLLFVQGL